jgi:hypothetical protein
MRIPSAYAVEGRTEKAKTTKRAVSDFFTVTKSYYFIVKLVNRKLGKHIIFKNLRWNLVS